MAFVVLSVSNHYKVFLNTNEYPVDLQIFAQALPTRPIARSINPFLPTIINHVDGKINNTCLNGQNTENCI